MGDDTNRIDNTKTRDWHLHDGEPPAARPDPSLTRRAIDLLGQDKMRQFINGDDCDKSGAGHDYDACVNEQYASVISKDGGTETAFVLEYGRPFPVDEKDVQQNGLTDCSLMATLAALASKLRGQAWIFSGVRQNKDADGNFTGYSVRLYEAQTHLFTAKTFVEKWIALPANEPYVKGHAIAPAEGPLVEIWPLLYEKAYAHVQGGYNAMPHGGPAAALEAMTGKPATTSRVADLTDAKLKADLDADNIVILASRTGQPHIGRQCPATNVPKDNPFCVEPNHAYVVQSREVLPSGDVLVHLHNPWGLEKADPLPIPLSELAKWFTHVIVGSS